MRIRRALIALLSAVTLSSFIGLAQAQAPGAKASAPPPKVYATLAQLMKGTLYPSSNVIFAAQDQNPKDVAPAKDPSTAVNPLESSYGKWQAVENASLAIAEVANLLSLPGRKCSNGRDVPINNADWPKFVQGLRDAAMATYKAAQTQNQDKIVDASGPLTDACAGCHDQYREKTNPADRCLPKAAK